MSRNALYFLALFTLFSAIGSEASTASAQGRAARTLPTRSGLFLEGGAWFTGDGGYYGGNRPWFRAEAGIHLTRLARSDLYLQLPLMLTRAGGGYYHYFGLAVVPGVRAEWTMMNNHGDLAVYLEGGGGIIMRSWGYDDSFCGGAGDPACDNATYITGLVRAGVGATYTFPFGLMFSVQPFGFGLVFGDDGAYGGNVGYYDASMMIGYRWP
jgi:hypothetical protein